MNILYAILLLAVVLNITFVVLFIKQRCVNPSFVWLALIAALQAVDFGMRLMPETSIAGPFLGYVGLALYGSFYFYGPLLYFFFSQTMLKRNVANKFLHLIPGLIFTTLVVSLDGEGFMSNYEGHWNTFKDIFSVIVPFFTIAIYLAFILKRLSPSGSIFDRTIVTILKVLMAFSVLVVSAHTAIHLGLTSDVWKVILPVLFSIVEYTLFVKVLLDVPFVKSARMSVKKVNISSSDQIHTLAENGENKVPKIKALFEEQQWYRDPELRLVDVANALNITSHQLSEVVNKELGVSFQKLVNDYRIEWVKQAMVMDEHQSIMILAFDAGFGSKTAFNRSFKEITGMTPSQWRDTNKKP